MFIKTLLLVQILFVTYFILLPGASLLPDVTYGIFVFADLVKLLAQNVTSFTKRYSPTDHPRILKYLKTRSLRQVIMPQFAQQQLKGGKGKTKRQKTSQPNQRVWAYLQEPA